MNDKMNKELRITEKKVIETIENHPETKAVFESLFPEIFENKKVFCKIGSILKRDGYPFQTYALFKYNGEVRLLNVTGNYFWKNASIKVGYLTDPEGNTITVGEFLKLTDGKGSFKVIEV